MNRNALTFSIITPVFNGERFLRDTIESVIRYAPKGQYEYIIVNDGSTDSTASILESFKDKIVVVNQENLGESSAVNTGLKLAQGTYCMVISADDPLFSEDLFHSSLEVLELNPEIVCTYPDWIMIDQCGNKIKSIITSEYSFEVLFGRNKCIPGPGAVFKTDIAKSIGGRNVSFRFCGDYDFWLRLAIKGNFTRNPKVLAQWRYHGESTSIRYRGQLMAAERIQVIEDFIQNHNVEERLVRMARGNSLYSAAILRYFDKSIKHRRILLKAFVARKGWIENAKVHELFYLLTIPFSELIWHKAKFYLIKHDNQGLERTRQ